MKKNLILLILSSMLTLAGNAQDRPTTKQECSGRCNNSAWSKLDGNPQGVEADRRN